MKKYILFLVCFSFLICSCEKDNNQDSVQLIDKTSLSGLVQKGPFLNGAAITLVELDDKFQPTGKTYLSNISDNSGAFSFGKVTLQSQYVILIANGYYFNEVKGVNSTSQLNLTGIFDVKDLDKCNVNILTHLSKSRIEQLISENKSFIESRRIAYEELYAVFQSTKPIEVSDTLNIVAEGSDNAFLLAISSIFQGYRTEAELSELMADFISDFSSDGVIENMSVGTRLINDSKTLILNEIKSNLQIKYADLGLNIVLPAFENVINVFNQKTPFIFTNISSYPLISGYGTNVLSDTSKNVISFYSRMGVTVGDKYSMAVDVPKGISLKVVINWSTSKCPVGHNMFPNAPIGWILTQKNLTELVYSAVSGQLNDLNIVFFEEPGAVVSFSVYENDSNEPSLVKSVVIL